MRRTSEANSTLCGFPQRIRAEELRNGPCIDSAPSAEKRQIELPMRVLPASAPRSAPLACITRAKEAGFCAWISKKVDFLCLVGGSRAFLRENISCSQFLGAFFANRAIELTISVGGLWFANASSCGADLDSEGGRVSVSGRRSSASLNLLASHGIGSSFRIGACPG
jgi:hypothetical protein